MATVCRLYVGIVAALALCEHYCLAEVNTTEPARPNVTHGHHHGNRANITVTTDSEWNGHFSKCPKELRYYCIHGECRYIPVQETPSCRCHFGYNGARCEYFDVGFITGDKRNIVIICIIAGLVLLILLIIFICVCPGRRWRMCWRRGRRREESRNGTEKLSMMDVADTHAALKSLDSREPPPHTDSV